MPKFLTRAEVYRILQRELPEDVYPDGAPSASYSTADMDSIADCAATGYANLEQVYLNYFPQTTDAKIDDWEIKLFNMLADNTLTLQERRDRVINRIRYRRSISVTGVSGAVLSVIPDLDFQLMEWGCDEGGWQLNVSELGISTFLNGFNRLRGVGPLLCEVDPSVFGFTEAEWEIMREEAYTYEVRIYNRVLTTEERFRLNLQLIKDEPARSDHVITDGLTDADRIDGDM